MAPAIPMFARHFTHQGDSQMYVTSCSVRGFVCLLVEPRSAKDKTDYAKLRVASGRSPG